MCTFPWGTDVVCDVKNLSVNGMRAGVMARELVNTTARHPDTDFPTITIIAEVANDVCNPHIPTIPHMTTPAEYKVALLSILEQLEAKLPVGSHVIFLGYFHGADIYDVRERLACVFGA